MILLQIQILLSFTVNDSQESVPLDGCISSNKKKFCKRIKVRTNVSSEHVRVLQIKTQQKVHSTVYWQQIFNKNVVTKLHN